MMNGPNTKLKKSATITHQQNEKKWHESLNLFVRKNR